MARHSWGDGHRHCCCPAHIHGAVPGCGRICASFSRAAGGGRHCCIVFLCGATAASPPGRHASTTSRCAGLQQLGGGLLQCYSAGHCTVQVPATGVQYSCTAPDYCIQSVGRRPGRQSDHSSGAVRSGGGCGSAFPSSRDTAPSITMPTRSRGSTQVGWHNRRDTTQPLLASVIWDTSLASVSDYLACSERRCQDVPLVYSECRHHSRPALMQVRPKLWLSNP